ncbi:hypothetical protein [Paenibacillus dendritiformis]|uniref:hypothetical protein n=1 Tax=Paenibacillus dendritiformis TaxID=130049 RepID=UPI00387E1464
MTLPPLQGFLQNCRNFSHVNGLKAIIGEIDALLQEFHQIVEQMAKIPAFTQDFAASSIFRSHCPRRLSHFPLPNFHFPHPPHCPHRLPRLHICRSTVMPLAICK